MKYYSLLVSFPFLIISPVLAETEISVYSGVQGAADSRVKGDNDGASFGFGAEWQGRSGEAPPYYGFRYTWWQNENWGYGFELNHAKVYAEDDTLTDSGFSDLEFTDGLNLLTINGFRRWKDVSSPWTPYVGAGVGLAIPHVDVAVGANDTFGYQVTGPAATAMAGVSYDINETWAIFGEYKGSFSSHTVDLDGGGTLETDIFTNAVNLGMSFKF